MRISRQYILTLLVAALVAATTPDAFAQKGGLRFRSAAKGGGGGFSMRSSGNGSNSSKSRSNGGNFGSNLSLGLSGGNSSQFSRSTPKINLGVGQIGTPILRGGNNSGNSQSGGLTGRLGGLTGRLSNGVTLPGSKSPSLPTLPGGKGTGIISGVTGRPLLPTPGKLPGITLPGNPAPGKGITLPGGTQLPGITLPGNGNPGNSNPGNSNPGNSNPGNSNPGNGNGQGSGHGHGNILKHAVHHWLNCHDVHNNHCVTHTTWCHQAPVHCHWWYNYCPTIYTHYTQCVPCNWNIIPCYVNGAVITEYRWYLGLSGMVLPGKGLGVESVEPNSPAEEIGLAPGMIIVGCNGFALTDNEQMAEAIRTSNGILRLDVKVTADAEIQTVDVLMRRLVSSSF